MAWFFERFGISVAISLLVGAVTAYSLYDGATSHVFEYASIVVVVLAPILVSVIDYFLEGAHRAGVVSFKRLSPVERGDAVLKEAVRKFSESAHH